MDFSSFDVHFFKPKASANHNALFTSLVNYRNCLVRLDPEISSQNFLTLGDDVPSRPCISGCTQLGGG